MVVVLVIVVVLVLIVLAGLALRRSDSETVTFAAPVRSIDVKLPAGGVRLTASDGDGGATVTRETRWLLTKPKLDERMDDGEVQLHVSGSPLFSGIVEYSLAVPAGADVTVWTSAGTIHATGLDGALEARSSAGGIYLDGCRGPLRLRTSAGSIEGEQLGSTDVEVHSGAGGVALTFAVPPERVEIETSAGSVDVVVPDDRYAVSTETSVGEATVDVTHDDAATRRIAAKTSAGSVRISTAS